MGNGLGRTRISDIAINMMSPAPVRPSIHYVKTGKRGISTPLISAVLRAVTPFQTSCALLASPLFQKDDTSGRIRTCSPCHKAIHRVRHRDSTRTIQPVFKRSGSNPSRSISITTGEVGVSPRPARLLPIPGRSA